LARDQRYRRVGQSKGGVVKPGLEVLLEGRLAELRGRKIGLVANPTSVSSRLKHSVGLLTSAPGIELTALFGPQHGLRGEAQAGEFVPFTTHIESGLPVFSLYGQSLKLDKEPGDIDALMRSFDVTDREKIPDEDNLRRCDVILFDIQDVGTRIYTYIATMAYVMEACARCGVAFWVLDRPNPINGIRMEGPLLDYPGYSSFVGRYPIPVRHGLTMGEMALLVNDRFLGKSADLTVIPMEGWRRDMWFDRTGLPWVYPSPNIPTLETALVYPGQVFLEGTNISEGRGTAKPFELFGTPWLDGFRLSEDLNSLGLEGIRFREAWFRPRFSKFQGELCSGCQLHVTDRDLFSPFSTSLHIIRALLREYSETFRFHRAYFDQIMGGPKIREQLELGIPVEEITSGYREELARFRSEAKSTMLYG
jgi:uncharacterized protein YbbC (DUF1343 family)